MIFRNEKPAPENRSGSGSISESQAEIRLSEAVTKADVYGVGGRIPLLGHSLAEIGIGLILFAVLDLIAYIQVRDIAHKVKKKIQDQNGTAQTGPLGKQMADLPALPLPGGGSQHPRRREYKKMQQL